jgi:demethoxyubiquinone hydroxylase (CLK1/Coq7/Cat5 family)
MMSTAEQRKKSIAEARPSIERMQKIDPESIAREGELGVLNFKAAVVHVRRLVDLYAQLPLESIEWFNHSQASQMKSLADSDYNIIAQIMKLDPQRGDPGSTRTQLINQLEQAYENTFQQLSPWVAYAAGRVTDFTKIGRDARATIQSIEDKASDLGKSMEQNQREAQQILDDIRKVAAEQGVSQQAVYFKDESDHHATEAEKWLRQTQRLTVLLALYAIVTLFLHKITWLSPS